MIFKKSLILLFLKTIKCVFKFKKRSYSKASSNQFRSKLIEDINIDILLKICVLSLSCKKSSASEMLKNV